MNQGNIGPLCTVRPLETQLARFYDEDKQRVYDSITSLDLNDEAAKMRFCRNFNILSDLLHEAEGLPAWGQPEKDRCWEGHTGTRLSFVRRDIAKAMGIFPAFATRSTELYNAQKAGEYEGKLRVACRWGHRFHR